MTGGGAVNAIKFLSQGVQFALFVVFVCLVLVFIKGASLEHRMTRLEADLNHYVTVEDFLETTNNLVAEKLGEL